MYIKNDLKQYDAIVQFLKEHGHANVNYNNFWMPGFLSESNISSSVVHGWVQQHFAYLQLMQRVNVLFKDYRES